MEQIMRTRDITSSLNAVRDHDGQDQAGRNFAEAKKVKKAKKLAERAKLEHSREEEDRRKFERVLDRCVEILTDAMNSGGDVLELLDPLISDAQCHMHSVLILEVLRKCYDNRDRSFRGVEKLDDKDKKILAYAVLFSLMRVQHKDTLGFVVQESSIHDFNLSVLDHRKKEKRYTIEARKEFNSYSVEYVKNVASDNIKEILMESAVTSARSKMHLLPFYASMHAVIDYIKARKLPIIVPLISICTRVVGKDIKYRIRSKDVRFYEFREDRGNRFYYKNNVGESEKYLPTVAINCYRLIAGSTPDISTAHDITDLLMLYAASHGQLATNTVLPAGYEDANEYVIKLYENHPTVLDDFEHYHELGKKYNLIDARYSSCIPASAEGGIEKLLTVERSRKGIFFFVDHIFVSNYHREYQRSKDVDCTTEVNGCEVFKVDVKMMTAEALKWLNVPNIV